MASRLHTAVLDFLALKELRPLVETPEAMTLGDRLLVSLENALSKLRETINSPIPAATPECQATTVTSDN